MRAFPMTLKEWAVAVKALEQGKQILILRKGGIREETRKFQVESDSFYLYPTYEHQKKRLLKKEYRPDLDKTLEGWTPDQNEVQIASYAKLEKDILLEDEADVSRLYSSHIWTERFAEERLRWKPKQPLHVLFLRIYKLDEPWVLPVDDSYLGCKSWIQLKKKDEEKKMVPVLSNEAFEARVNEIMAVLKF